MVLKLDPTRLPIIGAWIQHQVNQRVQLATRVLDDANDRLAIRSQQTRDRTSASRQEVLQDALDAWRENALARRIVELTTQYVVGNGIAISSTNQTNARFIKSFWENPLNRMTQRLNEWCDELTRSGELYVILTTDDAGMSYVRALPAQNVIDISTRANDIEQETIVWESAHDKPGAQTSPSGIIAYPWNVYNAADDDGKSPRVMHFAINRPVGCIYGESDLAPLLRWLGRYSAWLEDRVRLNRFRQTFLYVVSGSFTTEAERRARQAALNANPPNPGSILVKDKAETWEVIHPKLDTFEASADGLNIKKMIAAGSGTPLHFLAEPESSTRTTAEAAGGPTFRHYQQRQEFFFWMLQTILKAVVARRKMVDNNISLKAETTINGSDISGRDNASLATAATTIHAAFAQLRDKNLIDDAELLRVVYKFAAETVNPQEMIERARANPTSNREDKPDIPTPAPYTPPVKLDPITGEPKDDF